jgi:hypothetical protein
MKRIFQVKTSALNTLPTFWSDCVKISGSCRPL